jgi:amidophosphoribosyltransferase
MCGIVGIMGYQPANIRLYDALTMLQHRGQDSAGIATIFNGRILIRKGNGLAKDVFSSEYMRSLRGNIGIGHVRYPTAGSGSRTESQPFYVNSPYGILLAHNGNLTNVAPLKAELAVSDHRHLNTNSDSEVLLNVFAHELGKLGSTYLTKSDVFKAISQVYQRCQGAYAVVMMIPSFGLIAFRDPSGIRPLVYGTRSTDEGMEYMVSSESVALDHLGFKIGRDVKPGEAIVIGEDGVFESQVCAANPLLRPCIFEFVYLARPDSIMDGISVYKSRLRMGDKLAAKIKRELTDLPIDVVVPVPDTSRSAAIQVAHHLKVKYREGFIKNRYIGRTFIMPGQKIRKRSVRQKLNAIKLEFRGKNVLLVDDSIVRGTTCSQIIQMAREAGANKVYFASAAPAIRYPNVYGIDMPVAKELIAHGRTVQEVQESIGADWLVYLDLEDLLAAATEGNPEVTQFEDSVFSGNYVTEGIDHEYFQQLNRLRSDAAKVGTPEIGTSEEN